MFTEAISPEFAAQIENCEVNAWLDMYAAIPADFAHQFQPEIIRVQNIVLTRCKAIPFVHFNCVMNLGMLAPATESQIDDVLAAYHDAGVQNPVFFHIPHSQPSTLPEWYKSRGLHLRGGWERIYRNNTALMNEASTIRAGFQVEKVTQATGSEWATYLDTIYGLPTTPWLLSLVARPGWHHYLLRRGAEIAAVRSMYVHHDGMAWLGVEAPIPGIMAPSYDLDIQLCRAMVKDGIDLGAHYFVADIEAPTSEMNTPAYRNFEALGFKRPYFRSHYSY